MNRGMKVLQTFALPLGYVTVSGVFATSEEHYNIGTRPLSREKLLFLLKSFSLGVYVDIFCPELGIHDGLTAVKSTIP